MSKLLLKAIPANASSAAAEQSLGYIDTMGSTQRVSVKAQPKTVYRLVDAKTGEVIKNQTVLRQGKQLKVMVDGVNAVELDNFFPDEAANATAPVDSPSYLVDTGAAGAHTYGAVTAQTPVEVSANGMSVLWTPGMAAVPVAEPVAFGAPVVAAVSGVGSVGGLAALGLAAAAGNGGGSGGSSASKPTAKITGSAFKAEVADNTGLMVEAFDSTGKSRGKANVGADGKYSLTLDDSSYKGSLVLKMYDGLPDDGKTPKFYDEATGEVKDFTKPLYAVVNYGGDGSDIKVNVTPLTNLAATVAGVDTTTNKMTVPDGKTADQVVKEANTQVAQKFGLNVNDLTAADVQTTKSDTVNAYGVALAVMSKMEQDKSQDDVAKQFKDDSSGFTQSIQNAVTALKKDAGSNNEYLKNLDTSKLDKVSEVASDTTAPLLVTTGTKANTSSDGTKVYLHFDSELSKNTAGVGAFTVSVTTKAIVDGGADTVSTSKISSVAIDGNDVVLTLATAIVKGQIVTVSYTDPTASNDLLAVQDVAGNDAANISATTVVNNVADVKPVITVKAGQSFNYDENQIAKTINADEPVKVGLDAASATATKFRFTDSQSSVSKDGWYSIDKYGNISLTSVGLGAGKASNDFETKVNGGNALVYGVQAGDDAGNWSASTNITLNVNNVTPEAPTVSAPVSFTVTEDMDGNLLFDKATFANVDSGNTLAVTLFVEGNHGSLGWADSEQIQITENDDGSKTFTGASSALNAYFSTAGNLSYQHDTNFNGTRVLDIKVINESGTLSNSTTSKIKVLAVNDAPVASGTSSLVAIDEDNTSSAGSTVLTLFGSNFSDSKDAVTNGSSANTLAGVAITANAATDEQGVWQWSADGTSWKAIATSGLADATALYLAADAKLRFVPTSDYNGTPGALTARLVESSATALTNGTTTDVSTHGGATAYSAITIDLVSTVIAINDAPTVTAPATFTVNEDTAVNLLYTGTPFADIDSTNLTVTLSIADGTLSATTGGNVTVGGTAIARTFTGTAADLNTYFTTAGKITYTGAQDANGTRTLTTKVDDGSASNNTATSTTTITINAVNDAPTVTAPATFTVSEDTAGNLLYTGTPFADVDSTNLTVTLSITDGTISATTGGNVTVGGTAIARTFTGTAADLNTFFTTAGKITYTGAQDANGTRTLTTSVSDGSLSNVTPSTTTITINPVNDAPVRTAGNDITLNIDEDSASTATSLGLGAYTYSAGGGADETSGNSAQTLSYQFTNIPSSITLYKADGTTQVTVNTTGLTLSDMQGLKYKTVADANDSVAHNLTWKVTDSGTGTNSITEAISVKVNSVNDAPINTLPVGPVSVEANTSTYYLSGEQLEYSSKPITGLSITDVDAGSGVISVTLSVEHGSLAHIASSGVTFTDTSSSSFTASGNKSDLNAWLAASSGVTYTPEENSVASDTLTMLTDDGGNTGSGGTQTDTDSLTLNISDTRAPELLKAETSTNGQSIVLTYDEAIDTGHLPDKNFYSLIVTDGGDEVSVTVESVSASGRVVTLSLSQAIQIQHVVKLNYSDDTLTDSAGNDALSFTNQAVTIKVPDLVNPVVLADQSFDYYENQTADAVVAAVVATDNLGVTGYRFANDSRADEDDSVTYDGFFKIDSQGNIHITEAGIAANVNNYENLDEIRSKTYEVQVFDANDNYSDAVSVTLNVKNVNEAPTLTSISTLSGFTEDTYSTITYLNLLGVSDQSDVDAGDTIKFRVETVTTGTLQKWNGSAWTNVVPGSTTLATGEKLQWKPAADANGSGVNAFTVKAVDTAGLASGSAVQVKADVAEVNDAPTVVSGRQSVTLTSIGEDANTASIAGATVGSLFGASFSDAKDNVAGGSSANAFVGIGISNVASTVAQGSWQYLSNGNWLDIPSSTNGGPSPTDVYYFDVNTALRFKPVADFNGTPGGITAYLVEENTSNLTRFSTVNNDYFSATSVTLSTSVTVVNDAPTVVAGKEVVTLTPVNEDTASPAGASVTSLFGASFSDAKDAVTGGSSANTLAGVAIKANSSNAAIEGVWQWSTDGSNWTAIATSGLADATALYLVATTKLRFVPANNYNGTPGALTVLLVDNSTSLSNGSTIDVSSKGGTSAYSASTVSLSTSINAVNDAPTVTAPATFTVNEDTAVNLLYTGTPFADIDSTNLTVTLSIADGTISATTSGNVTVGGTATARTFTGTTADLNTYFTTAGKITYTGAQDANGTRTLTTSVSDGYLTNVNPSTTTITINAVNDAPVASGSATLSAINEDNTSSAGSLVSALFGSNFNDSKDTVANGSSANTLAGVAIKGNAALATEGAWQWQANGSNTWTAIAISGLADATALYLAADSKLRFVPASNYNGTPGALTARLVDSSASLTNGNTVDVSTNGGNTAYSATPVNLGTSITAVNDAPTLTTTAANPTFTESTTATLANPVSVFGSTSISTVEAGQKILGFQLTVTGVLDDAWEKIVIDSQDIGLTQTLSDYTTVGNGLTVRVSASGGTVTLSFSKAGGIDQALAESIINGMKYQHTQNNTPTAGDRVFTLTRIQDSGGTDNTGADTTALNNVTSTVSVVASNDAPVITVPSGAIAGANSGVLYSLPGGYRVTDDDAGASQIQISFKVTEAGQTIGDTLSYNTLPSGVNLVGGAPDANNVYTFKGRAFDLTNWMANAGFLKFTPTVGFNGTASIAISADDLGNTGNGGNQTATGTTLSVNVVSDSTPPALIAGGATTDSNGNIVLTYDDTLSANGPSASMFSVFMNGSASANNAINGVTVTGRTVTLNLATKIRFGDTVQVSYTDGAGNDTNAIQDSVGNDAVSLVKQTVTNSVPNVAPTLTSFAAAVATGNEDTPITVTFTNLSNQGNQADVDGSVTAFVVKTVNTGTLKIGTSLAASNSWAAGTNDVVNSTLNAYWTPALNANGTTLDAFSVVAKDNGGAGSSINVSATVAVTPVNDQPVRSAGNAPAIVVYEGSAVATAKTLGLSSYTYGVGGGADESASQTIVSYTITNIPSFITLWKSGGAQVLNNASLTLAELQGLMYKTIANANGAATNISWSVTDSGGGANTLTDNLSITVNPVNEAPVRTSASLTSISVNEDSANGAAVSLGLVSLTYAPGIGADEIASQTLTYALLNVPSFINLYKPDGTQVSSGASLILAELQGLKYKTIADANGSAAISWTVTDNGGGANPGMNMYMTDLLNITVNAVNDAPTRATGSPAAIVVNEDSANSTAVNLGLSTLTYSPGNATSTDESGQILTYTITNIPSSITLWKSGGVNAVTTGTSLSSLAELQGLQYKTIANANNSTAQNITWTVKDNGGGATDTLTENLSVKVTPTNDAATGGPTFTGSAQVGSTLTAAIGTLADIDGINGAITYTWQKSVDGQSWTDITTAATYTPVAGDFNNLLRVQANYLDGGGRTENVIGATMAVVAGNAPFVKNVIVDDPNHFIKVVFSEPMQEYAPIGNTSIFKTYVDGVQKVMTEDTSSESSGIYKWIETTYSWSVNSASSEVKFTYSDPTGDNAQSVYQDTAGTDVGSFNIILASMSNSSSAITGTDGNDYLVSNTAYHTITGGKGNDVMWAGGDGVIGWANSSSYADVFKWNSGDAGTAGATDTIKDFVRWNGTSGDQLDIRSLLAGGYANGSTLANWVKSITTGQTVNGVANSSVMVIDIDGTGSGTVTQVIVLEGVDLLAGLTGTYTTQLGTLKTNGVIIA